MYPVLFRVAGVTVSTYVVMFALACVAGMWISVRLARLTGMNRGHLLDVAFWAGVGGTLGAVLPEFVPRTLGMEPGALSGRWTQFGMAGAFAAGALAARWHRIPVLTAFDVCASGAAMAHAIGRIGCLAAGCCWGTPFNGPWAVVYHNPELNHRMGLPIGIGVHPTQLYEAVTEAILSVLAYRLFLRPHRTGQVMGTYLVLSSAIRFAIEFVRAHPHNEFAGPLSFAQWLAMAAAVIGLAWLVRSGRMSARQTPELATLT